MRVSEITFEDLADYIMVSGEDEKKLFPIIRAAAVSYVQGYTGMTAEELDSHEDITLAVLCLFSDMYEYRSMTVPNGKENPTVSQILSMYSRNLI